MSVDVRTRATADVRALGSDELVDAVLPDAARVHGDLLARGMAVLDPPPLGLDLGGRSLTLDRSGGAVELRSGTASAGVVAALEPSALSDLVQDVRSPMGLAMTERVRMGTCIKVREHLRPRYSSWLGFEAWAPLNADRVLSYLLTGN